MKININMRRMLVAMFVSAVGVVSLFGRHEVVNKPNDYVSAATEEDTEITEQDTNVSVENNTHNTVGSSSEVETDSVQTEVETEEVEEETEEPTESETEEENTYYCEWGDFTLTQKEYELLLTTVFCESGGESSKTQKFVTWAILNRLVDSKFPNNLHDVIYAKNAFSVTKWKDFENRGWTAKVEQSVQEALQENPHPRDMFYFRTGHYHSWAKNYKKVGKVYFSRRPN